MMRRLRVLHERGNRFSAKLAAQLRLHEMTLHFNNRKDPYLFRDTMLKLIESGTLEYRGLTKAA